MGTKRILRGRRHDNRARGSAVVEFAVILPLLITLLAGVLQYGYSFMVRQTATNAAREGCRQAVLQTATSNEVSDRVAEIMTSIGITNYSLDVTDLEAVTQQVSVTIPYSEISIVGDYFGAGSDVVGQCSMRKEGAGP